VAVVIPLKLVYTPVDATVTAIRNYQVPSTGEATYARWRKCENVLELQGGRTRRISRPGDSTGEHTGQKETALWARWGAHRERVEADA
jgi:uncharacterized membrane protein (UPF0127 family)